MHIFTILYVASVETSVTSCRKLFGEEPIESHPTFASFRLSDWTSAGAAVLQGLERKDFGDTFTIADPDGHRLRVMVSAAV